MRLRPLEDRVVIQQIQAEETTKSGIILPGSAQEKPQEAVVIEVGPGNSQDGVTQEMQVKPEDRIIYSKYAGTDIVIDSQEYKIISQKDILAVVEM